MRMTRIGALCAVLATSLVAACDSPTETIAAFPTVTVLVGDTVARQEPLRIVFGAGVSPTTALDPSNFVVIDRCTGLRVPGSLRLAGDTLIFSPAQALPFLTPLDVRIQNLLSTAGAPLPQPIVFSTITERPPVSDQSWETLDAPTNDDVNSISFATRQVGFFSTAAGSIFRTTTGGTIWEARFKSPNIVSTNSIHALSPDSVLMVATQSTGAGSQWGLFRSVDAGLSYQLLHTMSVIPTRMQVRKVGNNHVAVIGGQFGISRLYRYVGPNGTFLEATGGPSSGFFLLSDVALSPNAQRATAVFRGSGGSGFANQGFTYVSNDGGVSYMQVAMPSQVYSLRGTGYINDTESLLLGDSSVVLRYNHTNNTVVRLGAAEGIPQTIRVPETQQVTAFIFTRARFVPGSQIGWITGTVVTRRPNVPDRVTGIILISRDGGRTFNRQAVAGQPENGLNFAPIFTIDAFANDFAVAGGFAGFLAARPSDTQIVTGACAFNNP